MFNLCFSNIQARQIVSLYLSHISALIKKCNLEKHYDNSPSNLVLMFLIKASRDLSIPLEIEVSDIGTWYLLIQYLFFLN